MTWNRSSEEPCAITARMAAAIWIALLICSSAGCGKRVEYVNGDRKLTRLSQGQPAPRSGVLISEGYLSEIYVTLGQPKPSAEILDSKTAPAAQCAPSSVLLPAAPAKK